MKKVITENILRDVLRSGERKIKINKTDIITPLARDFIRTHKIELEINEESAQANSNSGLSFSTPKKIVIGSDHTGFKLKQIIKTFLENKSIEIIDVGTNSEDSCDYPDFAINVVREILTGNVCCGIMIDATGIPSSIAANKFPGIRAATCYNEFTAWSARNHNNANMLVIGAKAIGEETAKSIIDKWLNTGFEGGRHQRRLDKINEIEAKLISKP